MTVVVYNKDNGTEICRASDADLDYVHDSTAEPITRHPLSDRVPRAPMTLTRVELKNVSFPDAVYPGQGRPQVSLNARAQSARENELEFLLAAVVKMMGGGITLTEQELTESRKLAVRAWWLPDSRIWRLEAVEQ